ncbi:hypothetical protein [Auraticoccus monumenti]|uniref:Uncharacterized protein n=1 Tax=Auraticoccus monumenti TaxID=675864 RepID=A0A1G6U3Y3_9ACTN|nr:hypothetical protein [Auraticoccus monumenti]SDD36048.1 hypothetical protein SAMN04489747_0788 [Auraticoccus monumenti]
MSAPHHAQDAHQLSWLLVRRPWPVLVVSLCLAVLLYAGWVLWVGLNTGVVTKVAPAGATVTVEGISYRLVELYATDRVADVDGGEGVQAPPGASFVVAHLEVDATRAEVVEGDTPFSTPGEVLRVTCQTELRGADGMTWSHEGPAVDRTYPSSCLDGGRLTLEQVYPVPTSQLDRIQGVVVGPQLGPGVDRVLRLP